jgi:hypothetical protein
MDYKTDKYHFISAIISNYLIMKNEYNNWNEKKEKENR